MQTQNSMWQDELYTREIDVVYFPPIELGVGSPKGKVPFNTAWGQGQG